MKIKNLNRMVDIVKFSPKSLEEHPEIIESILFHAKRQSTLNSKMLLLYV